MRSRGCFFVLKYFIEILLTELKKQIELNLHRECTQRMYIEKIIPVQSCIRDKISILVSHKCETSISKI